MLENVNAEDVKIILYSRPKSLMDILNQRVSATFITKYAFCLFQMTCIRLLETLPVVFGRLCQDPTTVLNSAVTQCLRDLIDWGHSPLAVVVRYWKDALISLLILIKASCSGVPASLAADIEKLISCGEFITMFFVNFLVCCAIMIMISF